MTKALKVNGENYKGFQVGYYVWSKDFQEAGTFLGTTTQDETFCLVVETNDGDLIVSTPENFERLSGGSPDEEFPVYYDAQGREHAEF